MPRLDRKAENEQAMLERFRARGPDAMEKLFSRKDVLEYVLKPLARKTDNGHQRAVRLFKTFMREANLDPSVYLERSDRSETPSVELLKRFLLFRAQTGKGRIAEKLAVDTVLGDLGSLLSALRRASGRSVSLDDKTQLYVYVAYILPQEKTDPDERLSKEEYEKPVATQVDVEVLLTTLYTSATILLSFTSARDVLQMSLWILLMVDCAGRGGDISCADTANDRHKCLKWQDIALYVFRERDGTVNMFGRVTLRWLKGVELHPSKYKVVPILLRPLHMAAFDTLRQLIVLAIIDGVLPSWEQLEALAPPYQEDILAEACARVPISESFTHVPVLRSNDYKGVKDLPREYGWFNRHIKKIAVASGFDVRVTGYALRRGSAMALDKHTNKTIRRFMMGHFDTRSKLYEKAYQSKIVPVDVGHVFWGLKRMPERQMDLLVGMSADRVRGAPTRLSAAGLSACKADPEYLESVKVEMVMRAAVCKKYGSIDKARKVPHPTGTWDEWHDWKQADNRKNSILNRLKAAKQNEELVAFKAAIRAKKIAAYETAISQPSREDHSNAAKLAAHEPTTSQPSQEDVIEAAKQAIDDTVRMDEPLSLTDDDLQDAGDDSDDCVEIFVDETYGSKASSVEPEAKSDSGIPSDGTASVAPQDSDAETLKDNEIARDHGLVPHPSAREEYEEVLDLRKKHDVYRGLTDGTSEPAALASNMVSYFARLHTDFHFPLVLEPPPGTMNCRHCGIAMTTVTTKAMQHAMSCAKKHYDAIALAQAESIMPKGQECTAPACNSRGRLDNPLLKNRMVHHTRHIELWHKEDPTGLYPCFYGDCKERGVFFHSQPALGKHVVDEHSHVPEGWSAGSTYCNLCEEFFTRPFDFEAHVESHLEPVLDLVKAYGYSGLHINGRVYLPVACPFCLHDEDRRLEFLTKRSLTPRHVAHHITTQHLDKMEQADQCPCYAAGFCNEGALMSKEELRDHLVQVHQIRLEEPSSKRERPATADSDVEGDGKKVKTEAKSSEGAKPKTSFLTTTAVMAPLEDPASFKGKIYRSDQRCDHCKLKNVPECRVRSSARRCEGCSTWRQPAAACKPQK